MVRRGRVPAGLPDLVLGAHRHRRRGVRARLSLVWRSPPSRAQRGDERAGVVHDARGIHHRAADARSAAAAGPAGRRHRRAPAGAVRRVAVADDSLVVASSAVCRVRSAARARTPASTCSRCRSSIGSAASRWRWSSWPRSGRRAIYVFAGELALTPFGLRMGPGVRRHGAMLAAAGFLVLALGAWLDQPRQLISPSGIIQGASYADVHARMPAALALAAAALVGAVLSLVYALGRDALGTRRGGGPLRRRAGRWRTSTPRFIQRFVVSPNEQARETPYIVHNIAATRQGFALDRVEERELTGDAAAHARRHRAQSRDARQRPPLGSPAAARDVRTDSGDPHVLRLHVGRQRSLRDRRTEPAGDAVGARAQPGRAAQPHVDQRTARLHARPWADARAGEPGDQEGLPVLFIRDLPPVSTVNLPLTEPSIYFGELSNEYVIARTRAREFHYPKGEDNVYTDYDGERRRPARFVLQEAALRGALPRVSDPAERRHHDGEPADVRPADSDRAWRRSRRSSPTTTIRIPSSTRDGIFWIQDAYTTSSNYPYSTAAAGNINYIRNSVKIVDRRLPRHGDVLPGRADRSDRADDRAHLPDAVATAVRDAAGTAAPRPLPGRHLPDAGGGLLDLSHDESGRVLQQRRSVGSAQHRQRATNGRGWSPTTRS